MKPINDGGEAFPRSGVFSPDHGYADQGACGMSLRDWFAGQALMSMLTSPTQIKEGSSESYDLAARLSYRFADAMLAARESTTPEQITSPTGFTARAESVPDGERDVLTPGKRYPILLRRRAVNRPEPGFEIIMDNGKGPFFCLEKGCSFLRGGNWIIESCAVSGDEKKED